MQGELGDGDAGRGEAAAAAAQRGVVRRRARSAAPARRLDAAAGDVGEDRGDLPVRAGSLGRTSSVWPPTICLSPSGVSCAMTRPWSITVISSASASASSRYWVVSSTVEPSVTSRRTTSHMSSRLAGSRPVVGSSRKITDGRPTRLAARSSRRRMPPE